jgi:hypothetical protein
MWWCWGVLFEWGRRCKELGGNRGLGVKEGFNEKIWIEGSEYGEIFD